MKDCYRRGTKGNNFEFPEICPTGGKVHSGTVSYPELFVGILYLYLKGSSATDIQENKITWLVRTKTEGTPMFMS